MQATQETQETSNEIDPQDYERLVAIVDKLRIFFNRNIKKDVDRCNDGHEALINLTAYIGFFGSMFDHLLDCSPKIFLDTNIAALERMLQKFKGAQDGSR